MLTVEKYGIILNATEKEFENKGVLNPGVYQEDDTLHLLYRAINDIGTSSIGYAKTKGPLKVIERFDKPLIVPEFDYEKKGVMDAKIVKIEDTYYITYTAYDGTNALGALATSKDLVAIKKNGIISPQINYENYKKRVANKKNTNLNPKYFYYCNFFSKLGVLSEDYRLVRDSEIVLFPRKINGKFAMMQSIWPGIQIVYFDDFKDLTMEFWENYFENLIDYVVLDPKSIFETNHIGIGSPPIETPDGWLLIYYGVQETPVNKIYSTKAALLHLDKPEIELARLDEPLFSPTKKWEKIAYADDVVLPTGLASFGNELYIYYGAGDKHIAVAKLQIDELLKELKKQR